LEVLKQEKILVVQTAFLGDAILTLPMIQKLHLKFTGCSISVVCIPSTEDIFNSSPVIDHVFVYDKRGKQKSLLSFFRFAKFLKSQSFTRVYSPHKSLRSTLLVFLSKVEKTFGFDNASMSFLYMVKKTYHKNVHEVARNLDLIGYNTSDENWKILPEINISETEKEKISKIILDHNLSDFIVVAPASVWATKVYPKEYFAEVIKSLINKKISVVLIGSKEDRGLCNELACQFNSNVISLAGELTIDESIELIRNAKLIVSNDSAPTHMGMIANIPTLTIYCSTISSFGFYPYNKKSSFLSYDDLKCKPCGIHGHSKCPIKTYDCAHKLFPGFVTKKIYEMLALKEK
jgi:heptosyltransferase II